MTRIPGAIWEPVVNYSRGRVVRPCRGMLAHTAVCPATLAALQGVVNYFNNPAVQVSSYAVVGIDGTIVQCVDLDDEAWTQAAGNPYWVGVEFIGDGTKGYLTGAQIDAGGRILADLHTTQGVPLQLTDDPNGRGLGWHGMGAPAYGHAICPGSYVRAQLPQIVTAASRIITPPKPPRPPAPVPEDTTMLILIDGHDHPNNARPNIVRSADRRSLVASWTDPWPSDAPGKVTYAAAHSITPGKPIAGFTATSDGGGVGVVFDGGGTDTFPFISGVIAHLTA